MKTTGAPVVRASVGRVAAFAVVVVLLVPVLSVVVAGDAAPPVGSGAHLLSAARTNQASVASEGTGRATSIAQHLAQIESNLRARGVPLGVAHLPDLSGATPGRRGPVQPTYTTGPAPMGIADLGLRNESGTLTPYVYNTSSVRGSVSLRRAESVYLDGDGPDTFGIQLNAVATNVTLLGQGGYEFWSQGFVSYTPSSHQLSFGDNLWNFSSNQTNFTPNALAAYGPNGTVVAPTFYYALGPTFTVTYPFTVSLYLNASEIGGEPGIYFNYSLATNTSGSAGEFDFVEFNAVPHGSPVSVRPPAFQVNGTGVNPVGLPDDFEIVIVGNGNGDTTTFFAMNATISLEFWNSSAGAFSVVPAAFDAGSDTGETSDGILPVYSTPVVAGPPAVTVGPGPSFVDGLWNVSSALNGDRSFQLNQTPQNAFLFVSPGTSFNASLSQWVPSIRLGAAATSFAIPNTGAFQLEWMLSDHTPLTYPVTPAFPVPGSSTTLIENMTTAVAEGSYTPLLAWGNGEVAAIAQSGAGTAKSPYVLIHRSVGGLNPAFAELNDWGYPVFSAVLLINTTEYVRVVQVPATVTFGSSTNATRAILHLPSTNALELTFWNVTHVIVDNSTDLTGWLPGALGFFPAAEVLFWASSGNLVASDTFVDQGIGLALYGGGNNTIWGNTFLSGSTSASFDYGNNTTGILEWESGDLIYNNYFAVFQGALTPTADAVSCLTVCVQARYTDTWNVSFEPASASASVLGVTLTGSILHTWYQGGNYWSNYGNASNPFGVLPYTDSGLINVSGDYVPLYPSTLYTITFVETGLPSGLVWNETSLGVTTSSATPSLQIEAPNGTYAYSIGTANGYRGPGPGSFVVNGTSVTVPLVFAELFTLTVSESGLPVGWGWNVLLNPTGGSGGTGMSTTETAASAIFYVSNGTYSYSFSAYGFSASPGSGTVTVNNGPPSGLGVRFTAVSVLTVTASGLGPQASWTVTVTQGSSTTDLTDTGDGSLVFTALEIGPGPYTWTITVVNYTASPSSGSGTASTPQTASVAFTSVPPAPGPAPAFDWTPYALVVLAALAVAGLALFAWERRRRPPSGALPAPAAPATTGAIPPWQESDSDAEKPPGYTKSP